MKRNTTTGLRFEKHSNLRKLLMGCPEILVIGDDVFETDTNRKIGKLVEKGRLIKYLKEHGIEYTHYVQKKKLPDNAILIFDPTGKPTRLIVIETKFQETPGSADEKITTADYKRIYYKKLTKGLGTIGIDYIYLLSDWFKNNYKDELEYLEERDFKY